MDGSAALPSGGAGGEAGSSSESRAQGYPVLLVLDLGDCSLHDSIKHDHFAGREFFLIRKIAADLAMALYNLHAKGYIHADFKPQNAVRVSSSWTNGRKLELSNQFLEGNTSTIRLVLIAKTQMSSK